MQAVIYTPENTCRAHIYDVDTKERIDRVGSVDTETGILTRYEFPFEVIGDKAVTFETHYRSIYAIFGGHPWPCLFHCYGKIE